MDPAPDDPAAPGRTTTRVEAALRHARPWALFLGIVGIVSACLAGLFGIAGLIIGLSGAASLPLPQAVAVMMGGAAGLLAGGLWIYPSYLLIRFAQAVDRLFVAYDDEDRLKAVEDGLGHVAAYFRFNGILVVLGLIVYAIGVLIVCGLGQEEAFITFQF